MKLFVLIVLFAAASHNGLQPAPTAVPGFDARAASSVAADTLRLAQCYSAAEARFPLAERLEIADRIEHLETESVLARYRPSVTLDGQVAYHSTVPQLPFDIPGQPGPDIPRDQYKAALSVRQLIYDGGVGAAQRRLAESSTRLTAGEVDVALHDLKQRINNAFFGALLQDAALSSLEVLREEIEARREVLLAQAAAGLVDGGDVDVLEVELLNVDQRTAEATEKREGALDALEVLTGLELSSDVQLVVPDLAVEPVSDVELRAGRPELRVFEAQRERLALQRELTGLKTRPSVSSFATAAYGRPAGRDIFETAMSPFYSAGLRVSWSVWTWNTAERDGQVLALQEEAVAAQEAAFLQSVRAAAAEAWGDVERLRKIAARDQQIVALRQRIAVRAAVRLEEGVITATDYVLEQHAARRAELDRARHRIELENAKVRYATILGLNE